MSQEARYSTWAGRGVLRVAGGFLLLVVGGAAQDAPTRSPNPRAQELLRQLEEPDAARRLSAVTALGHLPRSEAQTLAPAVAARLLDADADVRLAAAEALGHLKADPALLEVLARELGRGDVPLRRAIVKTLRGLGPAAAATIPAVAAVLDHADPDLRADAAQALGGLGGGSEAAVRALSGALRDVAWRVRARAVRALAENGGVLAETALISALRDSDMWVRLEVIRAVAELPSRDPQVVVPVFEGALQDAEPLVRWEAVRALERVGEPGVPVLMKALHNDEDGTRWSAAGSLGRMGTRAANALPALRAMAASDPNSTVRAAAAGAVRQLEAAE